MLSVCAAEFWVDRLCWKRSVGSDQSHGVVLSARRCAEGSVMPMRQDLMATASLVLIERSRVDPVGRRDPEMRQITRRVLEDWLEDGR